MREFVRWQMQAALEFVGRGGNLKQWLDSKDFSRKDRREIEAAITEARMPARAEVA
jgi:hypothetical protein